MKKSKFGRLPVLAAFGCDRELAVRMEGIRWFLKAEECQEDGEEILIVNFYRQEKLAGGDMYPSIRIFFSKKEYISQVWETGKIKWKTAAVMNMEELFPRREIASCSEADERMIKGFLGGNTNAIRMISGFQQRILAQRLAARHRKTAERIDREMRGIENAPEYFADWVEESVPAFSRYFFYRYSRRNRTEGTCSCCGKTAEVESRNVRYGKEIVCPLCGKKLKALAVGKMPRTIMDSGWASLLQQAAGRLVVRYFRVWKKYSSDAPGKPEIRMTEYVRAIREKDSWKYYEWGSFLSTGTVRWREGIYNIFVNDPRLCPEGIAEALEGTPYRYSGLAEFARDIGENGVYAEDYLTLYEKEPYIERIVKGGFSVLVRECIGHWGRSLREIFDAGQSRLRGILRLSGGYFPMLPKDATLKELKFLQECCRNGLPPERGWIAACRKLGITDEALPRLAKHAGMKKTLAYLSGAAGEAQEKTAAGNTRQMTGTIRSWCDYAGWCTVLGYDLHDRYYLFPKNFKKAHDRVYEEYRNYMDKKKKEKLRAARAKATRRLRRLKDRVGEITDGHFVIVVPDSAREIREEGIKLHHCVEDYIPRVADKSTLILFLRKKNAPGKPFRTLEWKDSCFQQCQGKWDRETNGKEITDFLDFAQEKLAVRLGATA